MEAGLIDAKCRGVTIVLRPEGDVAETRQRRVGVSPASGRGVLAAAHSANDANVLACRGKMPRYRQAGGRHHMPTAVTETSPH